MLKNRSILIYAPFILLLFFGIFISFSKTDTAEQGDPEITPSATSSKEITIAAFGDSITAGYGLPLEDSYPMLLQKTLRDGGFSVRVLNMGVSGETTSAGVERVAFVLAQKPDIVLIGLGGNDMLRSLPPNDTLKNLDFILAQMTKEVPHVVLLGMESTASNGEFYKANFDAIYPSLSKKYNVSLVPFFLKGIALDKTYNQNDGIHPTKLGYEYIIKNNILPVLLPILEKL